MTTFMATFRDVAQQFGELIAAGNYPAAFTLLTPEAPGGIQEVQVMEEGIVLDWPAKQPGDVASVYVALTGVGFAEAVTVTVVQRNGNLLIRNLVWGRP